MLRRLELDEAAHVAPSSTPRSASYFFPPLRRSERRLAHAIRIPASVPSGELTNLPFLNLLARHRQPVILSTGMATLGVDRAVVAALGDVPLALLQCVSNYPAEPADTNLRAMQTMRDAFGVPVGYSDHTLGNEIAFAAIALGAAIIEKHFTLDRTFPGPDHVASSEPTEFAALVRGIRAIASALGTA